MRVLHVGPKNFPPDHGGVEKVVYDLTQGMSACDSHVFVQRASGTPAANVHILPKGLLGAWRAVRSYVRENRIDVVHLHKETFIPLALLLRFSGIACVLTLHGCAWRLKRWPLSVRAIFWMLDCLACLLLPAVVVVGKHDHAAFARLGGKRLHWIPNGVEPGSWRPTAQRTGAVYVGRISPEKNVLALVRAAQRANLPLDIYGPLDGHDPRKAKEFLDQVAACPSVRYRGALPASAVRETLSRYTTFISLSFSEGLPVAVLEAAAESLHLVLSDIPAHRNLGFPQCRYLDPHDIDLGGLDLAPAKGADENLRHVRERFDNRNMLLAYEAIYRSMTMSKATTKKFNAKGGFFTRLRSTLLLLPAWFAPHKSLRVFFHKLRGVDIGCNVEIGYYCILGNVHPHRIHIADNAVVAANCILLEHDNSRYYTLGQEVVVGDIHIEEGAFVGVASVILPNVTVGARAIVGAMSFVNRDVPSRSVAAGTPARVIRYPSPQPMRRAG